jgi:hypothetical protein
MNIAEEKTKSAWMDTRVAEAPPLDGDQSADVVVIGSGNCPGQSMILPDARSLPHGLAQLPEKLGRSGVAASRAW